MPDPTTTFVRVRFQLARFSGVYRIVKLPSTFTFAHLPKYILNFFG